MACHYRAEGDRTTVRPLRGTTEECLALKRWVALVKEPEPVVQQRAQDHEAVSPSDGDCATRHSLPISTPQHSQPVVFPNHSRAQSNCEPHGNPIPYADETQGRRTCPPGPRRGLRHAFGVRRHLRHPHLLVLKESLCFYHESGLHPFAAGTNVYVCKAK